MRAIPKTYAGVRFRSTLEADWAMNLDGLRMVWQYEPEGVVLPSGARYRCDFYLPRLTTFVEVKGPHNERIHKPAQLARAVQHAPGCKQGRPTERGPAGGCACGFGPQFPWRTVMVARAAERGLMAFEGAGADSARPDMVLAICESCRQYSFTDLGQPWRCRRCLSAGDVMVFRSGQVVFRQIDHEGGKQHRRHRPNRHAS